jgi:RNA polymerase sigma-70 factor (ECF subfamily)
MIDALPLPAASALVATRGRGQTPQVPMDEARFEDFYRRTAGALWAYLYRLSGDGATADDLLQKSFLRLLRADPRVATDEDLRNWLFRVSTNVALDHFRQTARHRARLKEGVEERIPEYSWGHSETRPTDLSHDLADAFAELTARERALLWLAHVEQAAHAEIGEALGVKTKSVKVLLFRARTRLRTLLSKRGLAP